MKEKFTFLPTHPDYKLKGEKDFDESFELLDSIVCPADGHPPPRIETQWSTPRICTFCSKAEESTDFANESHTLPASLGNRHHFSLEECDTCNGTYGIEYESHLAQYLNPERTFSRIRRRQGEGPPNLKAPAGTVEVNNSNGSLQFVFDTSEIEKMIAEDKRLLSIRYFRPPANRVSAIRSLLKTCWLIMNSEQRNRNPQILALVKKELNFEPWTLWKMFFTGPGFFGVHYSVWEPKNKNGDLPSIIVRLVIGNTVLLWIAPNWNSGAEMPIPFPPLVFPADFPKDSKLSVSKLLLKDWVTPEIEEKVEMSFESIVKGAKSLPTKVPPKPPRVEFDSELIHRAVQPVTLKTKCYVSLGKNNQIRITLKGGEFAGMLTLLPNEIEGSRTGSLTNYFEGAPPDHILKTILFFKSLRENKGNIELFGEGESKFLFGEIDHPEFIFSISLVEILEQMIVVNEKLNVQIMFKDFISQEDRLDLLIISTAIRNNGVFEHTFEHGSVSISCTSTEALKVLNDFEIGTENSYIHTATITYEFWGHRLPPLEREIVCPNIQPFEPISDLKNSLISLEPDENVILKFKTTKAIYSFKRWVSS